MPDASLIAPVTPLTTVGPPLGAPARPAAAALGAAPRPAGAAHGAPPRPAGAASNAPPRLAGATLGAAARPNNEFEFYCPAPLPGGAEQQRPKVCPTTESDEPPVSLDWESDSSIGSDEDMLEEVGRAEDSKPVGRRTRQVVK
nr:uncharacterized protein LOC117849139 [Setaria viridis]